MGGMAMKTKTVFLLIALLILPAQAKADVVPPDLVYLVDVRVGDLFISGGAIVTDGYLGIFPDSGCCTLPQHILDWGIIVSSLYQSQPVSWANGTIEGPLGGALMATPTQLLWNFDDPNGFLDISHNGDPTGSLQFGPSGLVAISLYDLYAEDHRTGWQPIAEVGAINGINPPVVTPLPTALPLFATGLGALGLLSWRRKRKAAATPTRRSVP